MFLEEQADIPWPALLYVTGIMQNAKWSRHSLLLPLFMLFFCIRMSIAIIFLSPYFEPLKNALG
jgi:hypothetical protein